MVNDVKSNYSVAFAIGIVAILHLVGIIGLHSSYVNYFEVLTPLNLLSSFCLLYYFHQGSRQKQLLFFSIAFTVGMSVEILGVQTGFPFGDYYYTNILSVGIFGVPLIIGINWFILSYGLIALVNSYLASMNYWLKSALGALLMTFMDVLIEPFAIKHTLWVWAQSQVPFENYIAWFLISFVIFLFGFKVLPDEKNKVAVAIVLIFFIFFALNLLIN